MNIFAVSLNPNAAARMLCDKHVFKMHVESVQLLVSLCNNLEVEHGIKRKDGGIHKGGHPHHPCCKWLEESAENIEWLLDHAFELCFEHHFRKGTDVFSYYQLRELVPVLKRLPVPEVRQTPFPLCMPEEYKVEGDPVESYRNYYIGDKVNMATWNYRRQPPSWWEEAFEYAGN